MSSGIQDVLYVRFAVPDLDRQSQFLNDFGFEVRRDGNCLYARGTDPQHATYVAEEGEAQFLGLGFEAESQADLERMAAIDGITIDANPLPGGGSRARFTDPDGLPVDLVFGGDKPDPLPTSGRNALNNGSDRPRKGARVVFDKQPQTVKRLGHVVLNVTDFRVSEAWYKERFGLLTSDEVYIGDQDKVLGAFMRCNRGDIHVDHHTLFLVGTGTPGFNHAAFEVADWDSLMEGHHQLLAGEYEHRWGIGKHTLGSQVFDYWKDPHDFTLEHFTDGDLFDSSFGPYKQPVEELMNTHWGPRGNP